MEASEYLGKKILFINPDTKKEETGTVTAIEDAGYLEINNEFIAYPEDVQLAEVVTKKEVEKKESLSKGLTAENIQAIEDKGILKAILKENNIRPSNPRVYKTAETLQKFIIESLQLKETAEIVKEKVPEKKAAVKPEKKVETPKVKPEKKLGRTIYICDLITGGLTDRKKIVEKVLAEFPDADERKTNATVSAYLSVARQFKIIK